MRKIVLSALLRSSSAALAVRVHAQSPSLLFGIENPEPATPTTDDRFAASVVAIDANREGALALANTDL
jgi:hypothetical protein